MGKREPQIILKTDERKIHLELGLEGKIRSEINGVGREPVFLEGTGWRSPWSTAAGC